MTRSNGPPSGITIPEALAIADQLPSGLFTYDVIRHIVNVIQQIKDPSKITAVISDDTSGRLLALLFLKLLNH